MQSITTYMDNCRSISLATRCTILTTELLVKLNQFNEAANFYIRLTGDDSELRSALFLEQASKCYLRVMSFPPSIQTSSTSTSPLQLSMLYPNKEDDGARSAPAYCSRYRKAAFYYILAGFRYNRCGLKHFALSCYRRFNYPDWEAAGDYVNSTVAKLFLGIATNNTKFGHYYLNGLQIQRCYSSKQQFFAEYMREIKKVANGEAKIDDSIAIPVDLYQLPIPVVRSHKFVSLDSIPPLESNGGASNRKLIKQTCYVGEQMIIAFQLEAPFELSISNVQLLCDRPESEVHLEQDTQTLLLRPKEPIDVRLKLRALAETEFTLTGLVFEIEQIKFQRMFDSKLSARLVFKSLVSLPLIDLDLATPQLGLDSASVAALLQPEGVINIPVVVANTEIITLKVGIQSASVAPSQLQLYTDPAGNGAEILVPGMKLNADPIQVNVSMPPNCDQHSVTFRLVYEIGGRTRTILRQVCFRLEKCLSVEMRIESVVTLKNLSPQHHYVLFDVTIDDYYDRLDPALVEAELQKRYVKLSPGESVHVLMLKSFLRWSIDTMLAPGVFRGGMLRFD